MNEVKDRVAEVLERSLNAIQDEFRTWTGELEAAKAAGRDEAAGHARAHLAYLSGRIWGFCEAAEAAGYAALPASCSSWKVERLKG